MLYSALLFTCIISGLSAAICPDARSALMSEETQGEGQSYVPKNGIVATLNRVNELQAHAFLVPEIVEKEKCTVCYITPTNAAWGLRVVMEDIQKNPCFLAVHKSEGLITYATITRATSEEGVDHVTLKVCCPDKVVCAREYAFLSYTTNAQNVQKSLGPFATYDSDKGIVALHYKLPTSTDNKNFTLTVNVDLSILPAFVINCTEAENKQKGFALGYDPCSLEPTPISS